MSNPDAPVSPPRRRPWALTFFGLLAIAGLVAMPILAGRADDAEMPDIVRFLGHFHPVLLHLPIGVFAMILLQELGAIFCTRKRGVDSLFPMFFGASSAILAVIAGFLLYHGHGGDYAGEDLAERHLWGGLVFAVGAVLTLVVKAWSVAIGGNPAWYRLLFFASFGVMGFASHDGASMTHGKDYLTRYAPDPIRKLLGLEVKAPVKVVAAAGSQVVYADIVAPIFERRCVSCHKDGKSKGKLRMDTFEMLVKGGKEGPAIEPGSADKSNVIVRIELPEDDGDRMPPDGKPGLNEAEVMVVRWWLDSGADPDVTLGALQVPEEIQTALASLKTAVPEAGVAPEPAGHGAPTGSTEAPDDGLKAVVAGLAETFPGGLAFESEDSQAVTFTAVSMRGKFDDAMFGKLAPVLPKLVSADLSATMISDKTVAALEPAKGLRMLRLAETGITDAAIESVLKLENLESLNFYGTKVTDAGVLKLEALPKLKRLYLWQTAVTPEAVKALGEKLPDCEIVTGATSSVDGA